MKSNQRQSGDMDTASPPILVVDDEQCVRDVISRWLGCEGFGCRQAADTNEARDHLRKGDVGLVTLDVNLPGRSGIDFLSEIQQQFPDVEVVMLTARGDTKTAISALTSGAASYLIKPIEREELLFHVRRALERRQLVIERRRYTERLEATVREQTQTIRRAHEETIHRLVAASMYRDEETGAHIKRVGLYSELLAASLAWAAGEVETIRMAAPMHDVGKIGIPDAILLKPGKLTPAEFDVMKTHTTIGAQMLAGSESPLLKMASEIALCHHERWDGSGYPYGLSGASIPLCARIVSIVDVFDALSHDRVYRSALPEAKVCGILNDGRGTHFDPQLLDLFLGLLPKVKRIAAENPDEEENCDFRPAAASRVMGRSAIVPRNATTSGSTSLS